MSKHPYADAAAHLNEGELAVVIDALEDAAGWRAAVPQDACPACRADWTGLCFDHAGDVLRAGRYAALAMQLRREAGR